MEVLVLEDDTTIGSGLKYSLEQEGYSVKVCCDIKSALLEIKLKKYGLYLLDLTLPDGSGYDICKKIKAEYDAPVIFLTAFDDEVNVVMGLELGADDYISKPFRVRELMARIKSVLRRYNSNASGDSVSTGNITVKLQEAKVYKNGEEIFLTALEYKLFLIFLQNSGKTLSRNQLLEEIWDVAGDFVNDNTLTVYIKRLREKIEDDPNNPEYILTVRGMGYRLKK